jgi:hypothetical protein
MLRRILELLCGSGRDWEVATNPSSVDMVEPVVGGVSKLSRAAGRVGP